MRSRTDTTSLLDLIELQEAIVLLEPEHFDQAIQLSQQAATEAQQWHRYLNGLALCGFLQWLEERAADLAQSAFMPLHLQHSNALDTVCRVQVGGFTLCLIVTESVAREEVTLPGAVVDLPDSVAHLYVLIEVQEEQEQVILRGCLRYDQLMQYRQANYLQAQSDWGYTLPLDCFDADSSHLLFYLRFLDPSTLALPVAEPVGQPLRQPEPEATVMRQPVTDVLTHLSQSVINVWHWSQDVLNQATQGLSWSIPQALTPAAAMRRSPEKVETALHDLMQRSEIEMPQQARYAYTSLEATPFQVCAVSWLLLTDADFQKSSTDVQEWALLLILVAQPGTVLPVGTKLQISTINFSTAAVLETTDLYLYLLVEGTQAERFTATIMPPDQPPIALPTFVCDADRP